MEKVIHSLIKEDQTGFIKGRNASLEPLAQAIRKSSFMEGDWSWQGLTK